MNIKKNNMHVKKFISLTEIQKNALSKGILDSNGMIIKSPTGSGKSYLAEYLSYYISKSFPSSKVLYIIPYVEAAKEKTINIQALDGDLKVASMIGGRLEGLFEEDVTDKEKKKKIDYYEFAHNIFEHELEDIIQHLKNKKDESYYRYSLPPKLKDRMSGINTPFNLDDYDKLYNFLSYCRISSDDELSNSRIHRLLKKYKSTVSFKKSRLSNQIAVLHNYFSFRIST